MSTRALLDLIDRATAQGVLPADAREQAAASRERPWPVVVLTFVGAFLASIPLAGFFLLMFEWALREHTSFYVLGALLVTLGVVLMRVRSIPLFFEQWGVIAFAAGFGMLWFVLIEDLDAQAGNAVICALAFALALALPAAWMRASLALLAGAAFAIAFLSRDYHHFAYDELPETTLRVRLVILAMLALWWAAVALVDRFLVRLIVHDERKVLAIAGNHDSGDLFEVLAPLVTQGLLRATTDFSAIREMDTINICVPTPLRKTKDPDMSYIVAATKAIAQHSHPGRDSSLFDPFIEHGFGDRPIFMIVGISHDPIIEWALDVPLF